jgi:hypothetical protein
LASDNPAAGSLISGAARVPVLAVNLTAGSASGVTVNQLNFKKTGVISDSNISGAYLVQDGKVVAQYSSLSNGVITFSNLGLSIAAGQTAKYWLAVDVSTGVAAGNTVGFSVNAASDVVAVNASNAAVTAGGTYPVMGNMFTASTVSNPSLAGMTITSSTVGNTVFAGTTNVLVSQWSANVTSNPVKLSSVKFRVIGSANKSDLQNVKLFVNGTQVGSTLPVVAASGDAYFDMSSAPATLRTGNSNVQIYADVMGSPSFNFSFQLLNSYDVYAVDTQYNVPVAVTVNGGSGATVTINQGQITVTANSATPTGNLAKGSSGVTLGKFNIYAAGEAVKVKFLDAAITTNTGNASSSINNIYLVDDAGLQIGTTINTVVDGSSSGQCGIVGAVMTCHFGTSASNINYIIPANTTRVISIKADILSTATGWTTITASLPGNSSNLQGLTSAQTSSSGSANGAALTLATNALTVSKNSAVGTVTYAKGATGAKVGSFAFAASSAEGVNLTNVTVLMSASSTDFQNLKLMDGSTQIGTTKSTLTGSDSVTFSGNVAVPAGGTKVLDVYADVLSSASAGTKTALTTLSACNGTGASTNSSISCPASAAGQNVTVSTGASMTVSMDSNTAATKQVVMSSTGNSLATFRFTETSNVESVKITDLIVHSSSSAAAAGFENVTLYNGTTAVAGPVSASSTTNGYDYRFSFASPVVVPQNGSVSLELKGDVNSYTSNGAISSSTYAFRLTSTSTSVVALGSGSNAAVGVTFSPATPAGNVITTLRGKLSLAGAVTGSTSGRVRAASDEIANLTLSAAGNGGYDVTVNTLSLKFTGQAITGTFQVDLIDPNTGAAWAGATGGSCAAGASTSCTATFTFTNGVVTAGSSKTVKVRVASSGFTNNSQTSDSMSVLVQNATDVNWGDGSTLTGLNLESTVVPVTVANISYE